MKTEATRICIKSKNNYGCKTRPFSVSPFLEVRIKTGPHTHLRRLKLKVMDLKLRKCRQAFKVNIITAKSSRLCNCLPGGKPTPDEF